MSDDVLGETNYISQLINTLNGANIALPNSGNIIKINSKPTTKDRIWKASLQRFSRYRLVLQKKLY